MSTLAFALAATIKHDGRGGVADLLATPAEAAAWLAEHQHLVTEVLGRPPAGPEPAGGAISGTKLAAGGEFLPESRGVGEDEALWRELVEVRRAVRALFARAVAPGAPSKVSALFANLANGPGLSRWAVIGTFFPVASTQAI